MFTNTTPNLTTDSTLKNAKKSFIDFEWQPILKSVYGSRSNPNDFALMLSFSERKTYGTKNLTLYPELRVRIAGGLYKSLGWEIGDRLILCYDKSNPDIMCIIKNQNGYKLSLEKNSKIQMASLTIRAEFLKNKSYFNSMEIQYELDKDNNRLFFVFPNPNTL